MTHAVVLKLLEGLGGRGHHVYTDNCYSSPALFGNLRRLGFGACGTMRQNRRGMPAEMKTPLKKGECVQGARRLDDGTEVDGQEASVDAEYHPR